VALYIYCPRCESRFDVTGCRDGTRLECDECGAQVEVSYENLVLMPGGIAAEVKFMSDGTRWLVCPKCGLNTNIQGLSPGNRFRCRRCGLLLQTPGVSTPRPRSPVRKGDDILKCTGCNTRYDISRYSPGNRFRCRRCGMTLAVPPRGAWLRAGEWEIDIEKSLIRCNRCNRSYPLAAVSKDQTFICKKCRRVFSEPFNAATAPERTDRAEEEWEIDVETGQIVCSGCKYGYDLTGLTPGEDFSCKHCGRVFRMPVEVHWEKGLDKRERIACPECGTPYDVSGYLTGTMFTCEKCDHVLTVGTAAAVMTNRVPIPEPPAMRMRRDPKDFEPIRKLTDAPGPESALEPPAGAEPTAPGKPEQDFPKPDFSYEQLIENAVQRLRNRTPDAIDEGATQESAREKEEEPGEIDLETDGEEETGEIKTSVPSIVYKPVEKPPEAPEKEEEKEEKPAPVPPQEKKPEAQEKQEPEKPAAKPAEPGPPAPRGKKTAVRLVVRCTVCGTRHDAAGKVPGDRIECKCGKKIRITAPKKKKKKKKKKASGDSSPSSARLAKHAEDLLDKKAMRTEDVDVIEPE